MSSSQAATPFSTTSTLPLFQKVQREEGSEYFFVDVPNTMSRQDHNGSHENFLNMMVVRDQVAAANDGGIEAKDIVILSFYEAQVRLLKANIPHGATGSRGCKEICIVDAFAGRTSRVAIVDFAIALPAGSYDLDRYHDAASAASAPKPSAIIRDPARVHIATTCAYDGLTLVGQFALLVSWIFQGSQIPNTIFCLAEDLFHRGLIVSCNLYVDPEALPVSDALGPRNNDMVSRYKIKRDAFIRRKIEDGRQRLGIVR
ncbi:MAG: hypothetical protein LQ337_005072 [Flavoplaca oasis]|nr:MAG: hypothetical protein LQ337_005072 [Flavoplaca oasis]